MRTVTLAILALIFIFIPSTVFAETSLSQGSFDSAAVEVPQDLNIDEGYVYSLTMEIMSGQTMTGDGWQIIPDGWLEDQCLAAGRSACQFYCRYIHKKHSYNKCMNGFLWIDGCLDKVEDFCEDTFGQY